MKKFYSLITVALFSVTVSFAQISNIEEDSVLASDNFEDDTAWVGYDTDGAPNGLNNQLGGTYQFNWSAWGGVAVNDGNSAEGGTKCLQAHWGGLLALQGFTIDPDEIYKLEVMVHPPSGNDGTWNYWGAIHLLAFDNTDVWQVQGFRVRIINGGESGQNPNRCTVDYWTGEAGDYSNVDVCDYSADPTAVYVNGTTSSSYWVPVKLIFTGQGTAESPFKIDYYLNDVLKASQSWDNIYWRGDNMIGLSNSGNDAEVCTFDNFKLTRMKETTTTANKKLGNSQRFEVYPTVTSSNVTLNAIDNVSANSNFQLYDFSGKLVKQGKIVNGENSISLEGNAPSVYLLKVNDGNSEISKTFKIIKQ